MFFIHLQASDALAIKELINNGDAKSALDRIKANPKCLIWKNPLQFNYTLLHYAVVDDDGGLVTSILEVNNALHTFHMKLYTGFNKTMVFWFLEGLPFFISGHRSIGVGKRYHQRARQFRGFGVDIGKFDVQ